MEESKRGRLKIFFGYAPGVGKTYAMLDDAQEQFQNGVDVIAGYIKTTTSVETLELLGKIPVLPNKVIGDKSNLCNEFDLDAALKRKPMLILIDELAHSNEIGVRNKKRYQDIEELLNSGIDVYTTVNVQNIESLNDIVQIITRAMENETVPDYIFDHADKVKLIDIEPDELLRRLDHDKLENNNDDKNAPEDFFTKENLRLLREVAMRKAADRISHNNQNDGMLSDKTTNTKLLVCISSSPSSAKCIRWTARTAEAFHAPWVAVYVENKENEKLSEKERQYYQANVELAEQLGAEITTLTGQDIATTVAQYAKLSGITNIVIGKSRKRKFFNGIFNEDLEDKLISLLNNTEIHIIPDSSIVKNYHAKRKEFKIKGRTFTWKDIIRTAFIISLTTIISAIMEYVGLSNDNIIMLYILAILIISKMTTGYKYGVAASILSVFIDNYFFVEPKFTFNVIQRDYPITFAVMLLTALITSTMTVRIKSKVDFAESREQRTEVLYEINKKLLVTRGLNNIVDLTNEYIVKIFGRSAIFYTKDPEEGIPGILKLAQEETDASFLLSPEESAVAHWVFINQKRAGADTDTLMQAKAYYMPVVFQGNVLGVLGVSCSNGLRIDQSNRAFMRRIASLVAMALERQRLSDEQRSILVETEKEKMRSNLLRAISHDLRTPLTGILGASSAILENKKTLDEDTKEQLISHIKDDSQWLIRMVENLLSVTRINEDTANVTKIPEAVEEIVAAAIGRIRKRFPEQKINVTVPDELLMVPMDGTLIEQVIINLIENAIKHSGETIINVSLKKKNNYAVIEVSDNGEGIPEQDFPYLFESYVPNGKRTSDSSRGMGIGLAICMSIIKAHQGKMEASNREDKGAVFRFTLPL
ncbi:MAG: sensor histidine kinase KdpD [Herbinix sp.]|nr:sensor histidine kinase KdpD [Herbinix sp.]